MSVSFAKNTIYEYLFAGADIDELSYENINAFCEKIRQKLTATSAFREVIIRNDKNAAGSFRASDRQEKAGTASIAATDTELPKKSAFTELPDKVICTDRASIIERDGEIERKYDEAYGTSVISTAMRAARSEVLADIETKKAEASKTSFTGKIFCLMGKSASGKDSVYALLRDSFDRLGLRQLVMYSTRPMRAGEANGYEYNFISADELDALDEAGKVIERRDYSTMYGTWSYAIVDDAQLSDSQCYVVKEETPQGTTALIEHFGHEHVFPIYIYVEDGVRLLRALSREMGQNMPKYDEVCRRYLSDCRDFEQVDGDGSVPRFVNDNLEKCAGEIEAYIEGVLGR